VREYIPMYLAAVGPKNLELAGELFDGWLALFYQPETSGELRKTILAGREKVGKTLDGFDITPTVPVVIGDDLEACAAPVSAYAALYVGGMGSREKNFYNALATRMGYGDAAKEIQDLYLARDYAGAAKAVPLEFIDNTALIGPRDRIRDRLAAYSDSGVTNLSIAVYAGSLEERMSTVRIMAEVLDEAGLAE
jgi:alkanesulfonate monooxygenase SsuD/methylene tetrahydromethanopterin reductase-like flavin-dependent oxidoreductase (luciferase family)